MTDSARQTVAVVGIIRRVRVAVHVGWRNGGSGEDRRYAELFTRHAGSRVRVAAFRVCLPQAAIL